VWAERLRPFYKLSFNKWYWDYLLDVKGVEAGKSVNRSLWSVDSEVIDGGVNGSAWVTRFWSAASGWWDRWIVDGILVWLTSKLAYAGSVVFRSIQTGFWQNYALLFTLGLFLIFFYYDYTAVVSGMRDFYMRFKSLFGK